ncbi:MAG: hypothetical protein IH936_08200 [Acidobacteria bacterium]|nr:hypothetical protein [Acidobacteriota bacterium]
MKLISPAEQIAGVQPSRHHLVILGAGASLQAFPDGDRNGRRPPLMEDLVEVVGLGNVLSAQGYHDAIENFEAFYSDLVTDGRNPRLLEEIERRVHQYFSSLALPDKPTLYDYLVLGLREKDFVATFNWDPFLWMAAERNRKYTPLPHMLHLHGNVVVGYCERDKVKGHLSLPCRKCGRPFTPSRLLFPVKEKNYQADPFVAAEWEALEDVLEHAYVLTIFGYSAPDTDVEAMRVMREAWNREGHRGLEEVEIIDIKSDEELTESWSDFIVSHHYRTTDDFRTSLISRYPRRTCEAIFNQFMMLQMSERNPAPVDVTPNELGRWYSQFVDAEHAGDTDADGATQ